MAELERQDELDRLHSRITQLTAALKECAAWLDAEQQHAYDCPRGPSFDTSGVCTCYLRRESAKIAAWRALAEGEEP